jgi:hypothetical protein
MQTHDNAYKNLFSHPDAVRDLLQGFVHEDWVAFQFRCCLQCALRGACAGAS